MIRLPDTEVVIWLSRIVRILIIVMATMINLVCRQQTPAIQNYGSCVQYSVCARTAITQIRATMKPMTITTHIAVADVRTNASTQSTHAINGRMGGDIMPGQNMDFLQSLSVLLRHGVEVDRAILGLQYARENKEYSLVERFNSYKISYTQNGWSVVID